MPYLNCQRCRLPVYSAAGHSTMDSCPRCGASLAEAPRNLFAPVAELMREQRPSKRVGAGRPSQALRG